MAQQIRSTAAGRSGGLYIGITGVTGPIYDSNHSVPTGCYSREPVKKHVTKDTGHDVRAGGFRGKVGLQYIIEYIYLYIYIYIVYLRGLLGQYTIPTTSSHRVL